MTTMTRQPMVGALVPATSAVGVSHRPPTREVPHLLTHPMPPSLLPSLFRLLVPVNLLRLSLIPVMLRPSNSLPRRLPLVLPPRLNSNTLR